MISKEDITKRFISYVTVDTESDPESDTTPSTEKQWNLANALAIELKDIGMSDVSIDDNAYIMATLPSNVDHKVPTIGFVSHFDTTPDFTGANVKPQIIENYDGQDIILKTYYCTKVKRLSLQMAQHFLVQMIKLV
jgi:tripeptide aminopeptidase